MRLPASVPAGLVWLEAERGPLLGAPRPLLLLPDGCQALAGEVQRLLADGGRQGGVCPGPLQGLGFCLGLCCARRGCCHCCQEGCRARAMIVQSGTRGMCSCYRVP